MRQWLMPLIYFLLYNLDVVAAAAVAVVVRAVAAVATVAAVAAVAAVEVDLNDPLLPQSKLT